MTRSAWPARSEPPSRAGTSRAAPAGFRAGCTPRPRRPRRACRCSTNDERPGSPRMTEIVDQLFDGWEAAWSGKDPEAFAEVCANSIHYEDPLCDEPLEGIDALTAHAERLWAGFPDVRLERTGERLHNGDFVAAPAKL